MNQVIVDTGPLVETLVPGGRHHLWVTEQWQRLAPPFLTCEAVISEAVFLLEREGSAADLIFEMLERGFLKIALSMENHLPDIRALMHKYRNRPMSVADSCLVRLSEIIAAPFVFTLDSDFQIYRRHGNRTIPLLIPK